MLCHGMSHIMTPYMSSYAMLRGLSALILMRHLMLDVSGTSMIVLPSPAYHAITASLSYNADFNSIFDGNPFQTSKCLPLSNGLTGLLALNYINQHLPSLNIRFGGGFTANLNAATGYLIPYNSDMS